MIASKKGIAFPGINAVHHLRSGAQGRGAGVHDRTYFCRREKCLSSFELDIFSSTSSELCPVMNTCSATLARCMTADALHPCLGKQLVLSMQPCSFMQSCWTLTGSHGDRPTPSTRREPERQQSLKVRICHGTHENYPCGMIPDRSWSAFHDHERGEGEGLAGGLH